MAKDIIISINAENGVVYKSADALGINGENINGQIIVEFFNGDFVDGAASIEIERGSDKGIIAMTKNADTKTYRLPIKSSLLSTVGEIKAQVTITQTKKGTEIPVFKSKIFTLTVGEAINATATIPDEYPTWLATANAKIAEMDALMADMEEKVESGYFNGESIEQIIREASNTAQSVSYDSKSGATIEYKYKTVLYKDSTTGETKSKTLPAQLSLPILPGKYVSMDATADNKKMEVKVDDTALAQDYFKIDKSPQASPSVPVYLPQTGTTSPMYVNSDVIKTSIASRDSKGDCSFHKLNFEYIAFINGGSEIDYFSIYSNTVGSDYGIDKTPTDTGTLTNSQLVVLQHTNQSKNIRIVYDNQVYYRMNPQGAPDGTLNYIHLDSIQNSESGYKATGKCFSVTVSTREWQVVDLDFGGSTRTTHNLTLTNSATDTTIYFSLTNNRPETYEGAPAGLWSALENSPISCTVAVSGEYKSGIITIDGDNFKAFYGNSEELLMTQTQVGITDSIV